MTKDSSGTPQPSVASLPEYLKQVLERRCQANPRYSLRAMAMNLKLEPSELSKIIHGKRGISEAMFRKLELRLGLEPALAEYFFRQLSPGWGKRRRKSEAVECKAQLEKQKVANRAPNHP